ncbi:methyl farnesoate epoxidase-like isoform X4 [Eriocheir sinensis]|uniref:methyl farnesoate epoxidase-like isoform X4 n=1 Tax=Eriocheir sinensis TaxID=95602 RepID=UPI0021C86313|nr:methyl farnesoate epoxidase-like isoform X4 [Eriocheir sinensis]
MMWLVAAGLVLLLLYLGTRKPRGYPPGPPRLPLMGYIPFMDANLPHKKLWRLSSTYGPVVGLFFGNRPAVVVNGWEAVKEALMNEDLNGRPESAFVTAAYNGTYGVVFAEGGFWKEQRRFTLHQFRNLGFAKRSHEEIVHGEVRAVIQEIRETKGSITLLGMLGVSNINILWAVMGGKRFSRDDPRLMDLVLVLNKVFRAGEISGGIAQALPFLVPYLPKSSPYHVVLSGFRQSTDFLKAAIEEHKATLDPDNPRDFIDTYLVEMAKQKHDPNSTFTEHQLMATCTDIFMAGTDTGSASVSFGILLMALHPEIMARVQKELDEVVGRERLPSFEDRNKLVYTDATLSEVFRFRGVAPVTVAHKAMRDTILQGHRIPADTMLLVNLYTIQMDPEYWGDPETFRPERFLNPDGSYRKDERHIPFGKGRRICLGESLARMTSFVLFTSLLQNFTFTLDPAVPVPNTEGKSGFTLGPPEFRVFAKPRV